MRHPKDMVGIQREYDDLLKWHNDHDLLGLQAAYQGRRAADAAAQRTANPAASGSMFKEDQRVTRNKFAYV